MPCIRDTYCTRPPTYVFRLINSSGKSIYIYLNTRLFFPSEVNNNMHTKYLRRVGGKNMI